MQAYMTSLVLLAAVALPVAAQEPQCQNANPQAQAACNTMVDATKAFHPLAGMIVSGGNPVLATAGTLGGFRPASPPLRRDAHKAAVLPPRRAAAQAASPLLYSLLCCSRHRVLRH